MSNRRKFIFIFIFIMIVSCMANIPKSFQNDTFWDIKVGERIIREGPFIIDNFSIHKNLSYIQQHFLFSCFVYLIYHYLGFSGLRFMLLLWVFILFTSMFMVNYLLTRNKYLSLAFSSISIFMLKYFIAVRAHIFSYFIFILEILLLELYMKKKNKYILYIFPLLSLILVNTHAGAWPFFIIILLTYTLNTLDISLFRLYTIKSINILNYILCILACIVISFINPFGVSGNLYFLNTLSEKYINLFVIEMKPFTFNYDHGLFFVMTFITIFIIFILTNYKIKLHGFLLILGTIMMTFIQTRHLGLFVIIACIYTCDYISALFNNIDYTKILKKPNKLQYALLIIAALLPSVRFFSWFPYVDDKVFPVKATQYIKQNIDTSKMRLFNEYEVGSYLILNNIKVFVDSRADLYSSKYNKNTSVLRDYFEIINSGIYYKDFISKYNLNYFLIHDDSTLSMLLSHDPNYQLIYKDKIFVLYKKL